MKWLSANKAKQLITMLFILVLAAAYGAWQQFDIRKFDVKANMNGTFQLGFYDLMSQSKEVYDSSMRTDDGSLQSTITSTDDNNFVFKGKFTQTLTQNGRLYFDLTPIYYSTPQKGLMIDGLVDLLIHTHFWVTPITVDSKLLVVGQSGAIFLYPLQK